MANHDLLPPAATDATGAVLHDTRSRTAATGADTGDSDPGASASPIQSGRQRAQRPTGALLVSGLARIRVRSKAARNRVHQPEAAPKVAGRIRQR